MKRLRKPSDGARVKVKKGKVHIIRERCKGCGFCVEYCPQRTLRMSDEFNAKGYHTVEVCPEADCPACGLCEAICPDFAIFVTMDEEAESRV